MPTHYSAELCPSDCTYGTTEFSAIFATYKAARSSANCDAKQTAKYKTIDAAAPTAGNTTYIRTNSSA